MAGGNVDGAKTPPVLEALSFPETKPMFKHSTPMNTDDDIFLCLLCDQTYNVHLTKEEFLRHLVNCHTLVIGNTKLIADFKKYIEYWRERMKEKPLTEFCTCIKTNTKDTDPAPTELYYLLCDALPEDKQLRADLQQEKLECVLRQQQYEREDNTFSRGCLFCRETFRGTSGRADLLNHMTQEHSFNVGLPNNLVYTSEYLDCLELKLHNLQCLYCEKTFKDRHVLKEHMRKKLHKKINPQNRIYDKYYVINYLEFGKNWEVLLSEDDAGLDIEEDSSRAEEWGDWQEDQGAQAVCLLCEYTSTSTPSLLLHMKDVHNFDLVRLREEKELSFYQQVKVINYIRRQVHLNHCISCEAKLTCREELTDHMKKSGHMTQLPDQSSWDQPEYYFPTYENDNLLCALEDEDDVDDELEECASAERGLARRRTTSSETSLVIAEDLPVKDSILRDDNILQDLRS